MTECLQLAGRRETTHVHPGAGSDYPDSSLQQDVDPVQRQTGLGSSTYTPFYTQPHARPPITLSLFRQQHGKGRSNIINTNIGTSIQLADKMCMHISRKGQTSSHRHAKGSATIESGLSLLSVACLIDPVLASDPCRLSPSKLDSGPDQATRRRSNRRGVQHHGCFIRHVRVQEIISCSKRLLLRTCLRSDCRLPPSSKISDTSTRNPPT